MYRRMYGHRRRSRQNEWVARGRMERSRRYNPPPLYVRFYNLERYYNRPTWYSRPSVYDRDVGIWSRRLGDAEKKEVEEANRLAKEEREKAKLEAARLEELRNEVLLVKSVDLHISDNTKEHHTDLYDCTEDEDDPQLVVRRGQEFKMSLTFQRQYRPDHDDMEINFKIGDEPNKRKGTHRQIKLREDNKTDYKDGKKKEWGARILNNEGNTLTIEIYTPPETIIGEWEYSIKTIKEAKKEEFECSIPKEIIIILNPWCKDDKVYYTGDDTDLNEYILNQSGACFTGTYKSVRSRPWAYAQFQEGILEISLHLLRKANNYTVSRQMADPIQIARSLSRILNDNDDDGVLTGRWDGKYDDGVRPTKWSGSAAILKKYWESKSAVKYGQCWVFSAILTTVARALGLPCRSVTNFLSAHDTNLSMTIDKYFLDEDEVEWKNNDSVWNFHVWNDVWINRPDLDLFLNCDHKYDGWHAVDATPQEHSDGMYQCGPAPLRAIKEGDVLIGYDTKFIFAECNADRCTWQDGDTPTLVSKSSNSVGMMMSTKMPTGGKYESGEKFRLDVTNLYKYGEGSTAERTVVMKAVGHGDYGERFDNNPTGVHVEMLEEDNFDPMVGQDLTIRFKVSNKSDEARECYFMANARPTTYWGGLRGTEKITNKAYGWQTLKPGESKTHELTILAADYLRLCQETMTMRVLAMAKVAGYAINPVVLSEDLDVALPSIDIRGPEGNVPPDQDFSVTISLVNPLKDRKLTGCEMKIEGDLIPQGGNFEQKDHAYTMAIGELLPGATKEVTVTVKPTLRPKNSKEREMEVGLASNELPDYDGSYGVHLE